MFLCPVSGERWSPVAQLHNIKQKEEESMRDYVSHLKHLNSRCKLWERLTDDQLLPCFRRGVRDHKMHVYLVLSRDLLLLMHAANWQSNMKTICLNCHNQKMLKHLQQLRLHVSSHQEMEPKASKSET